MLTKKDYSSDAVAAAHSALIEVMHILGSYRNRLVIIGGWVPGLLISDKNHPHIGSTDVDVAIDHKNISEKEYATIKQLLLKGGYHEGSQPYVYLKSVTVNGTAYEVQIDILAGEYEGTTKKHRHQKIQDGHARKARGCDMAFTKPVVKVLSGNLPDGSKDSVEINISAVIPFLSMKGMALNDRLKEKDAWDVYYCVKNYPGGIEALVQEFEPYRDSTLIAEGLTKIAKKFESVNHTGPTHVAAFEEIVNGEEIEMIKQDAFQQVNVFLKMIGIV